MNLKIKTLNMLQRFKSFYIFAISIILIFLLTTLSFAAVSVVDDKGRNIVLEQPAKRIISLSPHITELIFSAGAGDKIVGAVAYSDYPEAAKKIPRVGGFPAVDLEKIISLKPDLIISWPSGNNLRHTEKLHRFGIKVFMSEPYHLKDIALTIKKIGVLAGTSTIANKSANDFIQHYDFLKQKYSHKKTVKVFYQFWNKPIMTVNGQHLISNIINLCGGENIFAKLHSLTPKISIEAVISSDAQVFIAGAKGEKRSRWISEWNQWKQLTAVKNKHAYFIDPDLLNRMGPRVLQGADKICDFLERARVH